MTIAREDYAAIADEYVLGLLEEAEASRVEGAMGDDPELAGAVARARDRFLPLDTGIAPTEVPSLFWEAIAARLPEQVGRSVAPPQAPPQPEAQSPLAAVAGNDNRRSGWRVTAISAMAASLILAFGLAWNLTRKVEPVVVAVLLNEAGEVQAVVEDFGNDTATIRLLADFTVPAGKTIQVWTLPSREMGPMSLGLLEDTHSTRLSGSALPRPHDAQLYEITLERAGGSPTGRPTGPILAKGFAKLPR